MGDPQVPIDVDEKTGIWTTDGLPMIYLPRHFFINNQNVVEDAIGRAAYARQLYASGHKSAHSWCAHEAKVHGLTGMAVFHHYLKRLSQRGWAQFDGGSIDPETGCGEVRVKNSCFVLGNAENRPGKLCYLFTGCFPGALAWVAGESTDGPHTLTCEETRCANEGGGECVFEVRVG